MSDDDVRERAIDEYAAFANRTREVYTLRDKDGAYVDAERAPNGHGVQLWCPSRLVWAEIDAARQFAFSLLNLCDRLDIENA